MTDWLEHSVQVEVNVPMNLAWNLWADLEQIPRWMSWISQVKVSPENPNLSRWTLSAMGLEFSWQARLIRVVPHQIIQWESIDGLTNRGAVRFYDRPDNTIVKLTVAYGIPGMVGQLMDNLFLGRLVESTLRSDMERFREYVLKEADDRR
ncbi:MAG: SRPBCC family protein [Geitlerinemataceae cyanobacterium]